MRQTDLQGFAVISLFVAATVVVGCCGPSVTYDYASEAERSGSYRVGIGDVLRIAVWDNDELSGDVTVRPDGQITLQLIGEVQASGRTPVEIQQEISRRLVRYIEGEPNVTVDVVEVNSYRVYVVGSVNRPGEYSPGNQVTVLQALALARGLNEFADANHIVVIRRDEDGVRRIPFVHDAAVDCGRVEMDITLMSGDTVVVP